MLEDGEPGELPLLRNLHSLKQPKSLQDSPSTKTRSTMSPLVESISSITHESNSASLQAFHHERISEHDMVLQHGGRSSKRDVSRGTDSRKHTHAGTPGGRGLRGSPHRNERNSRMGSPHVNGLDSKMSWDLGREDPTTFDAVASDRHIQQNTRGQEHEEVRKSSRSVSRDRRVTDWVSSSVAEDLKPKMTPDMWNWMDLQESGSTDNHPGFFGHHQDEDGRIRAMQKTSNLEKGHKLWRQNDQVLSPLILNPNNDMHRSVHVNSLFTLEEPLEAEDKHDGKEQDWQYVMAHQRGASKTGTRSRPPLSPHDTRRSHRKHATSIPEIQRSPQIPNLGRQRYPEYRRMAPSESEFFEYEVEALELPSKRESGKSSQKTKYVNQSKGHATENARVKSPAMESVKGMRKKSDATAARQSAQATYGARSPEAEPLPLLTELEDYNGSDEFGGTSIDGELGRLSMSELHGELELVACHAGAPDRNNAGRLVKVADADRLQLSVQGCKELALCDSKPRNLSQKYRPRVFEEVVGQHIVAQALSNAILKSKIAPVYLFQGSRGTGKTSAARIFASALICLSSEGQRPCGVCRECVSVATGKCSEVREVDAASNNGVERVKALLEETISTPPLSRYKVFIIDECHVLTTETWNALLKILEEPPMNVVFILITTDADQLPRTVVSRCQKFPFPKIKDSEIVKRLQNLAVLEELAIDSETLYLIASRSDGSLRDAETILDQVSLLGQQINSSTVYELVGSVSDERMLGLLDSALVADTINTVRRARELVDSGVEPLSLMSRLATLITDILAGSFKLSDKQRRGFFRKQSLSDEKLERLRIAMKTLSEAEKQLRTSNDRTTWLIAALLQLGPDRSFMFPGSCMGTSVTQSPIALDENEVVDFEHRSSGRQTWTDGDANTPQNLGSEFVPRDNKNGHSYSVHAHEKAHWTKEVLSQDPSHGKTLPDRSLMQAGTPCKSLQGLETQHFEIELLDESINSAREQRLSPSKLNDIWCKVVERCQSNPLRQLLYASVKLISISISEVDAVVHLEVCNPDDNSSCGRSQKRIANLFEMVLGFPVEIKMSLASLPAEAESSKGPEDRSNSATESHNRAPHDLSSKKGYEWENQTNPMKPQALHHSSAMESFPAIPHGVPLKENIGFDLASSTWKNIPSPDSGRWFGHQEGMGIVASGESQEARGFSSSKAPAPGGTVLGGGHARHEVSHNDGHGEVSGYYNDIKGRSSGEDKDLDEIEMLSPEFNETDGPHDKAWPRHSAYEGPVVMQSYCTDGRRSSDADLQKRKGSHLSMVRRLSMRSRIQSLPSSDPNSPDRGPQYTVKGNTNAPKGKAEGQHVGEDCEVQTHGGTEEASFTQKKGKLKGGFARFFQGKLSKQGTDQ